MSWLGRLFGRSSKGAGKPAEHIMKTIASSAKETQHAGHSSAAAPNRGDRRGTPTDSLLQSLLSDARWTAARISDQQVDARRVDALLAIALATRNSKDFEPALREAQALVKERERNGALSKIACALAAAGHLEAARQAAGEIDEEWRCGPLLAIARATQDSLDFEAALREAQALVKERERNGALSKIACALAASGDLQGARQATQEVTDSYYRSLALSAIAKATGDLADFQAARTEAQQVESHMGRGAALLAIAEATGDLADFQAARNAAQKIDERWLRSHALEEVSIGEALAPLTQRRDLEATIIAARKVGKFGRPYACGKVLSVVVEALAQSGQIEAARKVAREIVDEDWTGRVNERLKPPVEIGPVFLPPV